MELRVLKYFLTVAREENISNAALCLHLTQPTLSRQLKELEDELGHKLFIRGNRKITLTLEGLMLRKRAEEIIELTEKAKNEIINSSDLISGNITIGSAEIDDIRPIFKIIKSMQEKHENIQISINSGDRSDIIDRLDKGLYDFAIIINDFDKNKYNYLEIPSNLKWGIICKKDSPLAANEFLDFDNLKKIPLIISRQMFEDIGEEKLKDYNIVGKYNLIFNASLMVDEGIGYALAINKLVNTSESSNLCFIPIKQIIKSNIYVIWKKYQVFNKASEEFIKRLNNII